MSKPDTIINGSSVGSKTWNHKRSPLLAPANVAWGKQSMQRKKQRTKVKAKNCFIKDSKGFVLYLWKSNNDYAASVEKYTEKCYTIV